MTHGQMARSQRPSQSTFPQRRSLATKLTPNVSRPLHPIRNQPGTQELLPPPQGQAALLRQGLSCFSVRISVEPPYHPGMFMNAWAGHSHSACQEHA